MLFYTTLLITSFLLTLAILGLKYLVVFVARKVFGIGKRFVEADSAAHRRQKPSDGSLKAIPSYRASEFYATAPALARADTAAPRWGLPESDQEFYEYPPKPATTARGSLNDYLASKYDKNLNVADWKRNIGRPARDDTSALAGTVYKPSQDAISKYGIDE